MIRLAVTDANIFIDLIILGLVEHLFGLQMGIHTTREVFDQLTPAHKNKLIVYLGSGALVVYNFSANELADIGTLDCPAGLEPADQTVFYNATRLGCMVISGDNKLRKFCEKKGLEVHDLVWVFDQIVDLQVIPRNIAVEKLEKLISYNDRLPLEEIMKRIRKWR
jgi:hypothetical protein